MKKNNIRVVLKGEKIMLTMIVLVSIGFMVSTVLTKATISETNIDIEEIKNKINTQEGINESLSMQIDELASLDKLQDVASSEGMTYDNNNIKNIGN